MKALPKDIPQVKDAIREARASSGQPGETKLGTLAENPTTKAPPGVLATEEHSEGSFVGDFLGRRPQILSHGTHFYPLRRAKIWLRPSGYIYI
jgi:hypothetical protein